MAVILTDDQWSKIVLSGRNVVAYEDVVVVDNKIFDVLGWLKNYTDEKLTAVDVLFWQSTFLDRVFEECRRILPDTDQVVIDSNTQIAILGTLRLGIAFTVALAELNGNEEANENIEAEA